tara:strand:+ start:5686 stop:6210 length:525 start_codon:yes stop_codon:yes gene_type:complete
MDIKGILHEKCTDEKSKSNSIRIHKKPMQLRDIENRSSNNRRQGGIPHDSEEDIQNLLLKEQKEVYKQPWNKLDNGMKINRLKDFIEKEVKARSLKSDQENELRTLLMNACNSNKLTKNTDVNYDKDNSRVLSIKPLKFNEETKKYTMEIVETIKNKSNSTKSKSNLDRFLKKK